MNLRMIYNKIVCLCQSLFAAPVIVQEAIDASGSGDDGVQTRLGDLTGDKRIVGLVISAIEGGVEVSIASGPEPSDWSVPTHLLTTTVGSGVKFTSTVSFPCPGSGLSPDTVVDVASGGTGLASILVMYFD